MTNIVNFNINIKADRKDIIDVFQGLIKAFKNDVDVEIKNNDTQNVDIKEANDIQKAHNEFFSKYVGIFDDKSFATENIRVKRLEDFKNQFGHLKFDTMPTKEGLSEIQTNLNLKNYTSKNSK